MEFQPPLKSALLRRRYKRFLADVVDADERLLTLHCPNTGAMTGCAEPGDRVWYSTSDNPRRKYPHTWELTETAAGEFIGINTHNANILVREALAAGKIAGLARWPHLRAEVKLGVARVDFMLTDDAGGACAVEVKSVTLKCADGSGRFPDARSERARRHLHNLMTHVQGGGCAALIYCVQHTGITRGVAPAVAIDPEYGQALRLAVAAGVQVLAWSTQLSPTSAGLHKPLPVYEAPGA